MYLFLDVDPQLSQMVNFRKGAEVILPFNIIIHIALQSWNAKSSILQNEGTTEAVTSLHVLTFGPDVGSFWRAGGQGVIRVYSR